MSNPAPATIDPAVDVRVLQNYIDGAWIAPSNAALLDVENPATGKVLAKTPLSTAADVDQAVSAALRAFPSWRDTAVSARCEPLHKLAAMLRSDSEKIASILSREMGKSLPDARAEMKRNIENVDVACGMPTMIQGTNVQNCAAGIDAEVIRVPIGVFGMIAPFNFPAMVPFWFLPYAIASGNTFVLKCSEQVPMTMQLQFEMIDRCGFPPGVVNLVNGDKTAAAALVEHPDVAGISFVGSSPVAQIIAERCAATAKRCQAMGSAKNYLVVMPDAKIDQVVRNMLTSSLGCAGQRCMAASAIACVGDDVYEETVKRFTEAASQAVVADPLDPAVADVPMVVGPVISDAAKQRVEGLIQTAIDEGARVMLDGRGVDVPGCEEGHFVGPTVLVDVQPGSTIEQTEVFGPVVIIMKFESLDEAIQAINDHPFGNGASIYTQSGYWARQFKTQTLAGMIGVNVGIPAPVAYLPFGGMKGSLHADIKAQSSEVVNFFTHKKIVTQRFWEE